MTTFVQRGGPAGPKEAARSQRPLKKYDTRLVDQFHAYCQAIARTARHRDEAWNRARVAPYRRVAASLIAATLLCYYLIERVSQAMSLF